MSEDTGSAAAERRVLTTCPRDCYDSCGVEVAVRGGRVRHVRGDRGHPVSRGRLCTKCTTAYNGVLLDDGARLSTPLLRDGPKGGGGFRAVSWAQALETIAARLQAIVDPATILAAHYTGTMAQLGYGFPLRFIRRLGAREVDPDTICNNAGHVALEYLYGTSTDGFDPRCARDSACILVWGANPSASAPHQDEHWLPETAATVIVVDPIRTDTAAAADLHLQPFPGSDAALAFALAHVIQRDGLLDTRLLDLHTVGFGELEPVLEDCSPAWAERACGVPAELIERAAHVYATGPSLLWLGQGLQRQPRGGNVIRAVAQLAALSGNLGRPGTGLLYLNGAESRFIDEDYVCSEARSDAPEPLSHMELAGCLEDPARARALLAWNINIAASNPEQARLRRALMREDLFTVAIDLFATDTTDLADVVLPAASFLESDDLVVPYFDLSLSAQVKAIDPPGEALPNSEIFRRLAAAMGYAEPELYESDRAVLEELLRRCGLGLDFAGLAERGTVAWPAAPRIQFADLRFPTPSGRAELASQAAAGDGLPRIAQPWADSRPAGGRLRLLSPSSRWTMNDSFANDAKIARRLGSAFVTLHPADAAQRGLADGDHARVGNETGALTLRVSVSDAVPRGVALSPKGRWPKLEPGGANVNVLNPGVPADMGASTSVHGVEVSVERVAPRADARVDRA